MANSLSFAVPGSIETRTGGTVYDKRVIEELRRAGRSVEFLEWPASFPFPGDADLTAVAASLAECPDNAVVLIDGLAFGAMPDLAAKEATRLRLVALVHHPLALETGLTPETADRLAASERRALTRARAVIVTSDMTATTLVRDYGVPADKIVVAKPGVDRLGLTDKSPTTGRKIPHLLSVATVTPRKGHDVLVAALGKIADIPWHCTIVGSLDRSPETVAALRTQIEKHRLADRISLVGEVADPAPLYRSADIFVLPSRYEGYGMAIADALAYGLPVVATRVGAIPEVVPPSAGILVSPDDVPALAGALRRLLTDSDHRKEMARAAAAAAAALPGWAETAARIASALDRVE